MYCMEHLLALLTTEKAKKLEFRAGGPPTIVLEYKKYPLQGPAITAEDVLRLFRSVATSRQMWNLRECGSVQFIYASPDRSAFLVQARMEDEQIVFEVS